MKTKLLAMLFLAGGSMFAQTRFSVGVNVGGFGAGYAQQARPYYAASIPPCPGPDYSWIDGYWASNGWVNGYWFRQPYRAGFAGRDFDHGYGGDFRDNRGGFVQERGASRVENRGFSGGENRGGDNNRGGQSRTQSSGRQNQVSSRGGNNRSGGR